MFGFGKKEKEYDVRLTESQVRDLTRNMSKKEKRDFESRQRIAEDDRFWDAMLMADLFEDD